MTLHWRSPSPPKLESRLVLHLSMFIRWLTSRVILDYQRMNRAGRIGYILIWISIIGMGHRLVMGTPPGAFGGIPASVLILGVVFRLLGWVLSLIYPPRRR